MLVSPERIFKSAMYDNLALIGKTVSSAVRVELLDLLSQRPRTVEGLATETSQSMANTSHHLQVLRRANLIRSTRSGSHVTYALTDPAIGDFLRRLRELGNGRLGDMRLKMDNFLESRGAGEAMTRDRLRQLMASDAVTVIDVRPVEEFHAGHLAGAISMPLSELESRMAELSLNRDVAVYCRGPYCVMALDAVEMLTRHGYRASRVEDGVYDFRAAGFRMQHRVDVK